MKLSMKLRWDEAWNCGKRQCQTRMFRRNSVSNYSQKNLNFSGLALAIHANKLLVHVLLYFLSILKKFHTFKKSISIHSKEKMSFKLVSHRFSISSYQFLYTFLTLIDIKNFRKTMPVQYFTQLFAWKRIKWARMYYFETLVFKYVLLWPCFKTKSCLVSSSEFEVYFKI